MRQGQQNRRGRGRHNNNNNHSHNQNQNRKGQNPLTRSYESNGPEVKIRGNPAHIAEKYISLARDAQTSGDPVLAENYLQHAEHYNRIIMAFREQQVQQGGDMGGGQRFRPNQPGEAGDDFAEGDAAGSSDAQIRGQEPQPPMFEAGAQDQQHGQPPAQDNPREHRGQRYDDRGPRRHGEQGYRHEQQGRPHRDRYDPQRASHQDRSGSPEAAMADQAGAGGEAAPNGRHDGGRRRERFNPGPQHEQPEFLRRPVRRPRREGDEGPPEGDDRD
jgi:hypothetical protein